MGSAGDDLILGDNGTFTGLQYVSGGWLRVASLATEIVAAGGPGGTPTSLGGPHTIYGNAGNDIIVGGAGGDRLFGGNSVAAGTTISGAGDHLRGGDKALPTTLQRRPSVQ